MPRGAPSVHPSVHPSTQFVHVAGTKGKGTVCELVRCGLVAQGKRVGTFTRCVKGRGACARPNPTRSQHQYRPSPSIYTYRVVGCLLLLLRRSPHLHTVRERIRLGDTLIPTADFVRLWDTVQVGGCVGPGSPEGAYAPQKSADCRPCMAVHPIGRAGGLGGGGGERVVVLLLRPRAGAGAGLFRGAARGVHRAGGDSPHRGPRREGRVGVDRVCCRCGCSFPPVCSLTVAFFHAGG